MALYTMPGLKRRASSLSKSLTESNLKRLSNSTGTFDIFLSQRRLDAEVVQVIYDDITGMGFSVYVDWIHDADLDRTSVNRKTADQLRKRLSDSKCLLYVATSGAPESKWMPWELGFKDGKSQRVAILPIAASDTSSDSYGGMEYLGLYPYVTKANDTGGKPKLWVHDDESTYVVFDTWLNSGAKPYRRP